MCAGHVQENSGKATNAIARPGQALVCPVLAWSAPHATPDRKLPSTASSSHSAGPDRTNATTPDSGLRDTCIRPNAVFFFSRDGRKHRRLVPRFAWGLLTPWGLHLLVQRPGERGSGLAGDCGEDRNEGKCSYARGLRVSEEDPSHPRPYGMPCHVEASRRGRRRY